MTSAPMKCIDQDTAQHLADLFKTLGDPTRIKILSLAALNKLRMKDKKVAVLISGGNIDISTISALISKALISRGRVFRFSVQLPDKPGQLLTVAQILTEQDANVIRLDHDQTMVTDSFQKVQLTVTVEAHGQEHIDRIVAALASNGFEINKIY